MEWTYTSPRVRSSTHQSITLNQQHSRPSTSDHRLHVSQSRKIRIRRRQITPARASPAYPCSTQSASTHWPATDQRGFNVPWLGRHWLVGVSFNKCNFDNPPQTRLLFIGNRLRRPSAVNEGFLESHQQGHWNGLAAHIRAIIIHLEARRARIACDKKPVHSTKSRGSCLNIVPQLSWQLDIPLQREPAAACI